MEPPTPRKRAACTIIARNYLAQARVLANSYLAHEEDGRFFILVVDDLPEGVRLERSITALAPRDLHLPEFMEMSFKYDVTELSTAVKPALMSAIFSDYDLEQLIYFDPDIEIFRPLDEMWAALNGANILLIPHLLHPIPLDGKRPSEQDILISGAYNLGFIGLHASAETSKMLDWWGERLRDHCSVDVAHGLFVDQKWMDLVPSLYLGTSILRDATYDVAYWNLHSRGLERTADGWLINGQPLAFFHFSGFDPAKPRELSKHQDRNVVLDGTPLAELLDHYAEAVQRLGFALTRTWPYRYGAFDNGLAISMVHRHLYGSLGSEPRREFGDPFKTAGPNSFFKWSAEPPATPGVNHFLEQLLEDSPDAHFAFPEARGRQQKDFLTWAQTWGAEGFGYDPRLANPAAWAELNGNHVAPLPGAPGQAVQGVNVVGYLTNETGLGAAARGFIRALQSMGVPLGLRDLPELTANRSQDTSLGRVDAETPYGINLLVVNADQHFVVKSHLGEAFFKDHYNIGYWSWELPTFPAEWGDRFAEYDEIWTPSSFIANALAPISPVPIIQMPTVLAPRGSGSREAGRRRLNVGDETFVFLFIFDFASHVQRKNPLAAIRAFTQAFASEDDVRLVVKCVNEQWDAAAFAKMHELAGKHPVTIYSVYWTADEIRDLTLACDAYVSLHRSEGLGHTIADAMAVEKPVIATGWSGNMDFMNVGNSFPVSYELVELTEDVGPYRRGAVWAEPSIDDASRLMRLIRSDPELARARGVRARRDIEQHYSEAHRGQAIQQRLAQAAAKLKQRHSATVLSRAGQQGSQLQPPGVPPMDLGDSSHGRLGILAKRGMNFLLRYHTHYQGELNIAFAAFMRHLQNEQDSLATTEREHVASLQSQLTATQQDLANARRDIARIDSYFGARPYMAFEAYGSSRELTKPMGYGIDGNDSPTPPDFADLFRGPEDFIADRQRIYLRFFKGVTNVVDLGSGRGEFLRLLCESGINAVGVEIDEAMVKRSRERGMRVELADAYDYLQGVPEDSLDVIFSAQFIEHVDSARLAELLELSRSRLRDRGLFIAETVNPESYLAQKTFFVDLTHQRPIFPHVLLHICQTVGYASARIFYPTAGGFTQTSYRDAGEYAVVAVK